MNSSSNVSRRSFFGTATAATAALAAGQVVPTVRAEVERPATRNITFGFPRDFWWGTATASYQVEGAVNEDGRKPSVWDSFSHTPGRTANGDTGDVADDHYHRFKDDVKLMAELGIKHYRFSIAWPRIVPDGRGAVNEKGVDFYKRLVDELLAHGITPHATLFHWDSPQALEDKYGSWRSREMAHDFADYTTATVQRLGDRIKYWMTINEIECFTYLGYGIGKVPQHAPGTVVQKRKDVLQTVHHALLAHGMACQAIRAAAKNGAHVSTVINYKPYVPVIETPENMVAAKKAFVQEELNGMVLVPILTGQYNPQALAALGENVPDVQNGDMAIIGQPLDALGMNNYTGSYVRAAGTDRGYELLPLPSGYPQMHMPWLNFLPDALYWGVRLITDAFGKQELPIYVSENGCAADDQVTKSGEIFDLSRVLYLRSYLRSAARAVAEGYPLIGYFLWSLLDNFEWSCGYTRRFGITYVDYKTQQRIPKQSFRWYQQTIRAGRVL